MFSGCGLLKNGVSPMDSARKICLDAFWNQTETDSYVRAHFFKSMQHFQKGTAH